MNKINLNNIIRGIKTTSLITSELLVIAEIIHSYRSRMKPRAESKSPSTKPEKVDKYYNRHHHHTKRKMKSLEQKAKDESLRDYILSSNKEWATSKLKDKPQEKVKNDPFDWGME